MFKDFHGFGEQMPVKKVAQQERQSLSVPQQMRKEAIEKLQADIAKNDPKTSEVVRRKRMEALLTLLESDMKDIHGELVTDESMMHFSEFKEGAVGIPDEGKSANESNLKDERRAA